MASKLREAASKAAKTAAENGGGGGGGRAGPMLEGAIKFLGGASLLGYLGYESVFNVEGGHRAVIFNRFSGVKNEVAGEGTHFLIPFIEWPIMYDIRTRPYNRMSLTGSKDLQMVTLNVRVLSRPDAFKLPQMYKEIGEDYDEKVLPSIVNEVCKQVVAKFDATQLLTQREEVSRQVRENLIERGSEFNILMDDVSITDLRFGSEFMRAVESKQVAQQEAERAKFIVDQAAQEKRSIIIKAQGEAESAVLLGKAMARDPGFVELRRIQAAKEIAGLMSRSGNKMYLDADTLMVNVMSKQAESSTDRMRN